MSVIEIVAALVGLLCVSLGARRSLWTYPTGIVSVGLFGAVFFAARLYSDALLQGFFVAANVYGWMNWKRSRAQSGTVVVESMTMRSRMTWSVGCVVATLGWGWLMHAHTDASLPWADAGIAIVSIAAQILMAQRRWENWVLWIGVDLASLPLYLYKELWVTAALYAGYLVLAVWGLVAWRAAEPRRVASA
jgi:nicotinamide mononucleotide transporter